MRKAIWIMGLFVVVAHADEVTIPNTFSAGMPAVAAEVNENFAAVEASVDDNAQDINALQVDVDANSAAVGELFTGLAGIDFESWESSIQIGTSAAPTVVSSVTVTAPGPGYIKVDFSGRLVISHTQGGTSSTVTCALKNDDTGSAWAEMRERTISAVYYWASY